MRQAVAGEEAGRGTTVGVFALLADVKLHNLRAAVGGKQQGDVVSLAGIQQGRVLPDVKRHTANPAAGTAANTA